VSDLLELAESLARAAGALQREKLSESREIRTKSSAIDLVTDVDHACEALIVERIRAARPKDSILSEELGGEHGTSGVCWVIDPLDGTTNYAHGFPHFAVSIGVERDGVREAGVVYDPIKEELFAARAGGGAHLNGAPVRVSQCERLERALLGTGFAYDVHHARVDNLDYFGRFMKRAQAVRRAGSAALDLAYVACGRFDGFWELKLHPWDVSAGILLAEEAWSRRSRWRRPAPASASSRATPASTPPCSPSSPKPPASRASQ
jgi:myo-inositol-1(or 4)-monophosphatase